MKKNLLLFSFMFLALWSVGTNQSWTLLPGANKATAEFKSINAKSDYTSTSVAFSLGAYNLREVSTPQGVSYVVEAPRAARIMKTGAPDLPLYAKSVIIPDADNMEVTVIRSNYVDIPNVQVAPSKGNLLRTVNPDDVAYTYGIEYQQNAFYPTQLAYLREPYILRDFRAQALVIQPVQYNPVTKTLRIYTDIEVEVKSTATPGLNIFQRTKALTKIDQEFNEIYKRQFVNYENTQKYTPLSDLPGNMLIICYDNFMPTMQPFVNWKIMKGIPTEMVGVSTIGNNVTSLKNYITNYYNTKGLKYLLLVGDFAQVTSPTGNFSGVTGAKDNEYAYITGNDHYQEFFVGRFSAETTADVQTQVDRSIYYEKILSSGDWLASTLGIGSDQGPGDDNEYDYQHIRGIQTDLMGFTYTTKYELFDGSQGGLDAAGNPSAANVSTVVNPGVGSIFYCGHGGDTEWVTTGFSNTNATALTNVNKLPFIYSVSCVIGHYNAGTCFCEAWMRAKQTSGPSGAIGIFGSTINQSWNPPMQAEDEMADILVESYTNNIKRTYAGIGVNGCFKMNDESADYDMTDTWTIFGDPSLVVRTKAPMSMTVTHPATIASGITAVDVNCNVDGAYIAITKSNQLLGTAYVSGGVAHITLNPAPIAGDSLVVCATNFNYTTYIGSILVTSSNTPFVVYQSNVIHDAGVAVNGNVEYSENVNLDVTLSNVGLQNANQVVATLSCSNPHVQITDNTELYGTINASSNLTKTGAFAFTVDPVISDQEIATFTINSVDDQNNAWTSTFSVVLNAPLLSATTVVVDDAAGNNNGRLDPGENATIKILTPNTGHAVSPTAMGNLSTSSTNYITVNTPNYNMGAIATSSSVYAEFPITVDASTPIGTSVNFTYQVDASGYTATKSFAMVVGIIVEDFESGNFTHFPWDTTAAHSGNAPWIILNNGNIFEGNYAARSGVISDNQTSVLSMTVQTLAADTFSFYKRVSCEDSPYSGSGYWYDYLKFEIDGTKKGQWDGDIAWSREAYFLTVGNHTLKWTYYKDQSASEGDDAAYIDYLIFPPIYQPLNNQEQELLVRSIVAYPNPCTDMLYININAQKQGNYSLQLNNQLGQSMNISAKGELTAGSNFVRLNTSSLPSGIYYLQLVTDKSIQTLKISVVK